MSANGGGASTDLPWANAAAAGYAFFRDYITSNYLGRATLCTAIHDALWKENNSLHIPGAHPE